tara:strand:- start:17 stop:454 length:438 start_codon:yes stop_codon:yes gene_type:complete
MEDYQEKFDGVLATIGTLKGQINSLQQQIKKLDIDLRKDFEKKYKDIEKRKNKNHNRKPSGFAKPSKISEDLANFMNKDKQELVARTEATRYIIEYIRKSDLQNKNDRRKIEADENLKKLLGITEKEELTYFNLQKYMNKHFVKE